MREREKIFLKKNKTKFMKCWNLRGKIFICVLFYMGMTDRTRLLKRPSTLIAWIN